MISNSNTNNTLPPTTIPSSTLQIGLEDGRRGVLFRREQTFLQAKPALQIYQVLLVHERGVDVDLEIPLQFSMRDELIIIHPFDAEQLERFDSYSHDDPNGVNNKWMIVIQTNSGVLTAEIAYICDDLNDLAKNPLEYLLKSYKYFAREFELFNTSNQQLFTSLFNNTPPQKMENYDFEKFFGKYYPLVCHVKKRFKKGDTDNKYEIIGDGLNRNSILNSFSRFSRILMSLNLGKCLMVVKFDFQDMDARKMLKECKKEYCLSYGIQYQGHKYELFATSNSGLKGDTCYFYNSTLLNIEVLKELLGTFQKAEEYGARKVASRVGLSMGTSFHSLAKWKLDEMAIIHDDKPITDGAGMAVEGFFEEILEKTYSIPYFDFENLEKNPNLKKERLFEKNYKKVNAIQIRTVGIKGVIQKIDNSLWDEMLQRYNLPKNTKLILRDSMLKFEGNYSVYNKIDVYNVSGILGGKINRTTMSCLIEMADNREKMEQIFMKHFESELNEIVENKDNPEYLCNKILNSSSENSKESLTRQLILAGYPLDNYFISTFVKNTIQNKFQSMINDKLCFKLKHPKFLSLMGVFDESLTLKENEVYIPCSKLTECPEYSQLDRVLVYRNPLAYEGDIQCLKLVKNPPSKFLKSRQDVIVFGHKPQSTIAEPLCYMASGDLDGDLFEIIFDPEIINNFVPNKRPNLDYNQDLQNQDLQNQKTKKTQLKSASKLTMKNVREALFEIMTEMSQIGLIYYQSTIWRHDPFGVNVENKKKISKLYHDSIDTIKGTGIKIKQNEIPYLEKPEWYDLQEQDISEKFFTADNTYFETRMFNLIKGIFSKMEFEQSLDIDTDFEKLSNVYESERNRWKVHFENTYKEWKTYWTKRGDDTLFIDNKALHKKKATAAIMESISEKDKINWHSIFMTGDQDSLNKLIHKAAYWMNYAYTEFGSEEFGNLEQKYLQLLASPFLYSCCLYFLNIYKEQKRRERDQDFKYPQLVTSQFVIGNVKNAMYSKKLTRTSGSNNQQHFNSK